MITADTITDEQIRELKFTTTGEARHQACLALGMFGTEFQRRRARARCAEILSQHTTRIETEARGVPVGNGEHHLHHRWSCSCGAVGPWGHALWAKISIKSAEESAQRHVLSARAKEAD